MDDLYPNINDPNFNIKIAKKKEFNEHAIHFSPGDVAEKSDSLCTASFELSPHQQFVKNFLSINTPYNSLMLFHGLGTGKTCSAIGVSEEMRLYMKQMGITKKIIIVAAPNVQENFKQQLFDERKMEKIGGVWSIVGCSGKNFLDEINPINLKGLTKEKIIRQVERLIKGFYLFMGYGEFANFISKRSNTPDEMSDEKREILKGRKLRDTFENRMIIIDEVHNIRSSDNKKEKRVASKLDELIKYVHPLRLVLLTATPMYNDPREIIWLINLMNKNDGRSTLSSKEIFDKNGNFIIDEGGEEIGKQLFMRKSRGYISFVKGDNPYTFPYRIFPHDFKATESLKNHRYPEYTLLGGEIAQGMEYMDLFCVEMGPYQSSVYQYIIDTLKEKQVDTSKLAPEMMERFGYTILQKPLEALNMTYPSENMTEMKEVGMNGMVGIEGLERVMKFKKNKTQYQYKPKILEKYGRIFAQNHIEKYSIKLKRITKSIVEGEGISLVYSQFLDGGVVPLALALEEMGCDRYGAPNLLKEPPKKKRNITYTMITGNEDLSPNNALAVKIASARNNIDGDDIKIIIISRAGSEGLDFANIRQVHILEPWYNTNRIAQTIGRAIRNCSHKFLPFSKRNSMIFLYSTLLKNNHEAADMYVYRVAEMKAILIGRVARALKEGAIDCILNKSQQDSTEVKMKTKKKLVLANGKDIMYMIGDKPFSEQCDYMEKCAYTCSPTAEITSEMLSMGSYFIPQNSSLIMRIKDLFKEHYFYKKDVLVRFLQYDKPYSEEQINMALNTLIEDKTEIIEDRYRRAGNLINIGEYYIYHPLELDNPNVSLFERNRPIDYKRERMILEVVPPLPETEIVVGDGEDVLQRLHTLFKTAFTPQKKTKKSEKDWYKNASNAIIRLEAKGMERSLLEEYIVEHIWDTTPTTDKIQVLDLLFGQDRRSLEGFSRLLNKVIDQKIMTHKSTLGTYLQEDEAFVLYVWQKKKWKKGEKTDNDDFIKLFAKSVGDIIRDLNAIYGFIIPFKDTNELIFKTKMRDQKRQSGARCDQASKKETIKALNLILANIKRNSECSGEVFSEEVVKTIGNVELCCYTELILRCYNHHRVNGKVWFVGPEYAQKIIDHLKN